MKKQLKYQRKSTTKIWLSSPHIGDNEITFVNQAFDTNWIAPLGPNVDAFEKDIESYIGNDVHVGALNSGTSAIHLALILMGVKAGDEVICQSFTFSASANPILYLGAVPIFVDSESETWNLCPDLLEMAIQDRLRLGKKPKAIIVVHLYGMPAKMQRILQIASKYEIPILEDAAEALGSSIDSTKCGSFGTLSILSFNGNKIITTSGGGAILSKNLKFIERARFLATQARDAAPHYEHSNIGYNYRLSNVCAGIGRGQMMVLKERIMQRRKNFQYYQENLAGLSCIKFLKEPPGMFSNRWLSTIFFEDQQDNTLATRLRQILESYNIEARPLWKPLHLQPVFKGFPSFTNGISEKLFKTGLCLPSGSNLTNENLSDITNIIKEFLNF